MEGIGNYTDPERESYCRDIRRGQTSKGEHKKYSQGLFNDDIITILEEKVQSLTKEHWSTDNCPPEFWITLNNENMDNQKILITINHLGYKFTEVLFPRTEAHWGYASVLNQMINMYNQTM